MIPQHAFSAVRAGGLKGTAPRDRLAAVMLQCRSLSDSVDFCPEAGSGSIILNITCVAENEAEHARRIIAAVLASPFAFCNRFVLAGRGAAIGGFTVPAGSAAIGTVCSLTLNGLLLNCGIQARPRYGGVVAVKQGLPEKFSAFLSSGEALLAPLDDFLHGAMTSVGKTLSSGTGEVLASFLELPASALETARQLYGQLRRCGLAGKILFGTPSEPLLGMPVSIGCAGMVVFRDINTVAALAEQGLPILQPCPKILHPFEQLSIAAV